MTRATDEINVSIAVPVGPETAFRLFTEEIDLWWQRGRVYRTSASSSLRLEPNKGGRFLDVHKDNGQIRQIGRVQVWEPGKRLLVEWRGSNFKEDELTFVEVIFTVEGDSTRVAVRHYGWDTLPQSHPVRHGLTGQAFVQFQSRWWADLLTRLRRYVAANSQSKN